MPPRPAFTTFTVLCINKSRESSQSAWYMYSVTSVICVQPFPPKVDTFRQLYRHRDLTYLSTGTRALDNCVLPKKIANDRTRKQLHCSTLEGVVVIAGLFRRRLFSVGGREFGSRTWFIRQSRTRVHSSNNSVRLRWVIRDLLSLS